MHKRSQILAPQGSGHCFLWLDTADVADKIDIGEFFTERGAVCVHYWNAHPSFPHYKEVWLVSGPFVAIAKIALAFDALVKSTESPDDDIGGALLESPRAKAWKHGHCDECRAELSPALDGERAKVCFKCSRKGSP